MDNGEEVVDPVPLGMSSVSTASLNCLPDELLVHVLSSLETKQAASTSVLSKRWRTLFAVRRNLDFDDSIISHPEVGEQNMDDVQESFRDFVDKRLAFQGSVPINKFSLIYGDKHDDVRVDRWINTALEHGVSELHLCLTSVTRRLHRFPSNVFRSTTLVKLTLGTNLFIVYFPSDTCLPVLKILVLDSIWFDRIKFSNVLLAGCPALEDLTIDQKSFPGLPNVVSSKTVKSLSIVYKYSADFDWFRTVALDTPNLVTLLYSTYARHRYRHCNLESLVNATLDLHFLENCDEAFEPNVTDLMIAVRNVQMLHLTSSATEVISQCCKGGLPMFKNLLVLVFLGNTERVWKVFLPLLLEHSPNLTKLCLEGLYHGTDEDEFDEIHIPRSNKVNMLRIIQCQGTENELKHISHFLLKMECLQLVQVNFSETIVDSKKVQLTEDLMKLPSASSRLTMQVI
ncbi:unnamed protein product [Arabidopsis thaliana]|uniref:F-box domain-containing protein n=1 Tax=Arabidopsis thaliana TaxID=3702 RepID=A0A5S9XID4_ARATH|nr:unnamed protein product [Arabidopsis thaliana]